MGFAIGQKQTGQTNEGLAGTRTEKRESKTEKVMAVLSKFYGTSRLLRPAGLPSAGLRCGAAHKWAARAAPPYLPPEPGRARMLFLPGFKARFHAIYGGWEVIVGIAPVRIVEGEARERVRATVLEWAKAHQMELLKGWGGLAAAERPETIEPLS